VRIPIARGGFGFILPPLLLAAAFAAAGIVWIAAGFLLLSGFLIQFFRDPDRPVPGDENLVLSPADGTILSIGEAAPGEAPEDLPRKIVIFMSVFNCHVNRSPASATIVSYSYTPGKKLAAFSPKASAENEQNRIELRAGDRHLIFKQIAGALARRIVFRKRAGDRVALGERVGMIRFGSRVDLFLPASARVDTAVGDRVKAGLTALARWGESA
jgi:phosphatidylserine decarboxylase